MYMYNICNLYMCNIYIYMIYIYIYIYIYYMLYTIYTLTHIVCISKYIT